MTCPNCGANEWKDHACAYCKSQHPDWETWGWVDGDYVKINAHNSSGRVSKKELIEITKSYGTKKVRQ